MGVRVKHIRYSAVAQTALGSLLVLFGIADRVNMFRSFAFHTISVAPIWIGLWIMITGVVGTRSAYTNQNNKPSAALIGTYLGFSITSVVFAGALIILYVTGVYVIHVNYRCDNDYYHKDYINYGSQQCKTAVALGSMVVIFAILEFGFGIMACVCCCMSGVCHCCYPSSHQMQNDSQANTPFVITQFANWAPVVVPAPGDVPIQSGKQDVPAILAIYPPPYNAGYFGDESGANYSQAPPLQGITTHF